MKRTVLFCISALTALSTPPESRAQDRPVAFRFDTTALRASLDSLRNWYSVSLIYLDRDVEGKKVTAACDGCTLEEALGRILAGTSLTWLRIGDQVVLKHMSPRPYFPQATVSGSVIDSATGDWIEDAALLLRDVEGNGEVRRWCSTNSFGFYSLRNLPPGKYVLTGRAIGYRPVETQIDVVGGSPMQIDVPMAEERITLQEVTVEGRCAAGVPAEGFTKGIFIRSAPTEQTQYLLDGTRIYNPSHFGGLLSTFNAEALNDVERGIAGIPPYYGGRIGGILDLSLREGNRAGMRGAIGTGSLGSSIALEGPLSEETTCLLSARREYPDAQVPSLADHGTPGRLGSTEVIAKLSHRLSPGQRLFVSGYVGRDAYSNIVGGTTRTLSNNFGWGNRAANLRWVGIASPSVFLQASAAYTRYDFSLSHIAGGVWPIPEGTRISSEYAIEDMSFRAHAEHFYDESHTLQGGMEFVHHRIAGSVSDFSSQTASFTAPAQAIWELSVYLQDQWKILPKVTAELGVRATMFAGEKGSYSAVDPRFSLLLSPTERTKIYASLIAVNQFLHPYRGSGIFLFYPTVFWYPSGNRIGPSTSLQASLGIQRQVAGDHYVLGAESFYQSTQNIHDVALPSAVPEGTDLYDALLSGTGRSYGIELTARKRTGDLTGSINYTLARAEQMFPGINGGAYVASRFDRRHEIHFDIEYRPDGGWLFGILGVLVSGEAPLPGAAASATTDFPARVQDFIDPNGARLPGFQRLELKAIYGFKVGAFPAQIAVRFVNGYGLLDPIGWDLRPNTDLRFSWRARLNDMQLFPLFPTIGMIFRF